MYSRDHIIAQNPAPPQNDTNYMKIKRNVKLSTIDTTSIFISVEITITFTFRT